MLAMEVAVNEKALYFIGTKEIMRELSNHIRLEQFWSQASSYRILLTLNWIVVIAIIQRMYFQSLHMNYALINPTPDL